MSLQLLTGEVEVLVVKVSSVDTSDKAYAITLRGVTDLALTNHRLVFVANGVRVAALHLCLVTGTESTSSFLTGNKLRISTSGVGTPATWAIACASTGFAEFSAQLQYYLDKRSWLQRPGPAPAVKKHHQSPSLAGVGGIIRRQDRDITAATVAQTESLSDMQALVRNAQEVVRVIQQYSALKNSGQDEAEADEMEDILRSLGSVVPVSKRSASSSSSSFYSEVAAQVSELLLKSGRIQRMGGIVSATDAYYLYNRARGSSSLISPDDFLLALDSLPGTSQGGHGLCLHRYPTGVNVIRLRECSDEDICRRVLDLCRSKGRGLSSVAAASALGVSVLVAKEQLLLAEDRGILVRDQGVHGLLFYPNLFDEYLANRTTGSK
jgi:hypothetical protein